MITIESNPSGKPSVHDTLFHCVSSDNSATTDFKYVFDVWVNGVQKIRIKQFPEPSNSYGYFDASMVARNSITYEWFEPTGGAINYLPNISGECGIKYQLRVGEEVSGIVTTNMASGETTAYNYVAPLWQRRVITLQDRLNKWLTNRPLYANCELEESLYIGFYTDTNIELKCKTYDYSNAQIDSFGSTGFDVPNGFVQLNIGPSAIQTYLGITIDSNVKYYEVQFNSLDKFRVYLTCNPKYSPTSVHFLNRWGVWDTHRFPLVSKLAMQVERKGYEQRDYQFNGTSVDFMSTVNRYYESKINHSNVAKWNYKLTSDFLTDDEWEWLADLITSPQILMQVDGYYYPVTINVSNYDYKKFVNDKLQPLEIEFELNQKRQMQLR